MSIDSKSVSLLSSDSVLERADSRSPTDMETVAQITATFTRLAFFLSILVFSGMCVYEYATALLYGKDSMPAGWVGLLVVFFAMVEMTMADYADRLSFYCSAKAASLPYGFFVLGGLATSFFLLLFERQIGGVVALHLMVFFAFTTTVLGVTVIWRSLNEAGESIIDTMEKSW